MPVNQIRFRHYFQSDTRKQSGTRRTNEKTKRYERYRKQTKSKTKRKRIGRNTMVYLLYQPKSETTRKQLGHESETNRKSEMNRKQVGRKAPGSEPNKLLGRPTGFGLSGDREGRLSKQFPCPPLAVHLYLSPMQLGCAAVGRAK